MDLNYLYQREQVSRFRTDNAACEASRQAHLTMACIYAERIAAAKADNRLALRA